MTTFSQCIFGSILEPNYNDLKSVPVDGDEKLLYSEDLAPLVKEKLNSHSNQNFVKILDEISSKRSNITNVKISKLGKSLIFTFSGIGIVRMIELSSS